VNLVNGHVEKNVDLNGASVTGLFDAGGVWVGGNLFLRKDTALGMEAKYNNINLLSAHVEQSLELAGAVVTGALTMSAIRVNGNMLMGGKAELSSVTLSGGRVGGNLSMNDTAYSTISLSRASVTGVVNLRSSTIDKSLNCFGLEVGGDFFMDGAELREGADCRAARIKGLLALNKAKFDGPMNLAGAEIDGALQLGSTQWSKTKLTLRNARIGQLPDLGTGWAPKLDLNGLTYGHVDKFDKFDDWFGRTETYSPQPYDQLASTVQRQGQGDQAIEIRISGRNRERRDAGWLDWIWLSVLNWAIGYGYYPFSAAYWACGMVVLGVLVLRLTKEGPRNGMPYGIAYSFDTLLPLVRLRERHYQIDLKPPARYYFYVHRIMGYVLASFLIAGLSGLTK
jgi:hypothetical protein